MDAGYVVTAGPERGRLVITRPATAILDANDDQQLRKARYAGI
jgi:hypothetical protein